MKYPTLAQISTERYGAGALALDPLPAYWAMGVAIDVGHPVAKIKAEYSALNKARARRGLPTIGVPYGHPCF